MLVTFEGRLVSEECAQKLIGFRRRGLEYRVRSAQNGYEYWKKTEEGEEPGALRARFKKYRKKAAAELEWEEKQLREFNEQYSG